MRLLAFLLLALFTPAPIDVANVTFEHLALISDVICVGTVEGVEPIAGDQRQDPDSKELFKPFQIARLTVTDLWKGPAGLAEVNFVGSSTWVCDITGVKKGERVLLLLNQWDERFRTESVWAPELTARLGTKPFYSVCWAGIGQLPLHESGPDKPQMVDLFWLPWTGKSKFVELSMLRDLTRRILSANGLGTVRYPTSKEAADAAILRQEVDSEGHVKTSVVAALFELDDADACAYWSVAKSGAGAPFRRGVCKEGIGPVYEFRDLPGAERFLDPPAVWPAPVGPRELIVTRNPMFSMTRPGVPLPEGAPKPEGPDAAERILWNEMRRRIISLIPKESQDVGEVKLEVGG